ncbi:MAG: hypothetical protein DMF61_24910 [Blastocatellia bacterium AA13]|nr:MAG: hypothetical protein DMF61_24910 [Blastocatellia bacterium AA13]
MFAMPMMTPSSQRRSDKSVPFASVAFADHGRPMPCVDCPCDPAINDCQPTTAKRAGSSSNQAAAPASAQGSLSLIARTMLFVLEMLARSGA